MDLLQFPHIGFSSPLSCPEREKWCVVLWLPGSQVSLIEYSKMLRVQFPRMRKLWMSRWVSQSQGRSKYFTFSFLRIPRPSCAGRETIILNWTLESIKCEESQDCDYNSVWIRPSISCPTQGRESSDSVRSDNTPSGPRLIIWEGDKTTDWWRDISHNSTSSWPGGERGEEAGGGGGDGHVWCDVSRDPTSPDDQWVMWPAQPTQLRS